MAVAPVVAAPAAAVKRALPEGAKPLTKKKKVYPKKNALAKKLLGRLGKAYKPTPKKPKKVAPPGPKRPRELTKAEKEAKRQQEFVTRQALLSEELALHKAEMKLEAEVELKKHASLPHGAKLIHMGVHAKNAKPAAVSGYEVAKQSAKAAQARELSEEAGSGGMSISTLVSTPAKRAPNVRLHMGLAKEKAYDIMHAAKTFEKDDAQPKSEDKVPDKVVSLMLHPLTVDDTPKEAPPAVHTHSVSKMVTPSALLAKQGKPVLPMPPKAVHEKKKKKKKVDTSSMMDLLNPEAGLAALSDPMDSINHRLYKGDSKLAKLDAFASNADEEDMPNQDAQASLHPNAEAIESDPMTSFIGQPGSVPMGF